MASEDIFEEDFSEEIITELDKTYASDVAEVEPTDLPPIDIEKVNGTNVATPILVTEKAPPVETESKLFQLPLTRIRNIMKLDPDVNIASNEAVFMTTRATERFIESMAREAYMYTSQAKKKTIHRRDVDLAITAVDSLMFLDGAMTF